MQHATADLDKTAARENDLFLLGRIARGDGKALADLFDERAPAILGVLCRVLAREEAETVLQEVFTEVWKEASNFHPNGTSPFGWMLLLARSRAADRLRARRQAARPPPAVLSLPMLTGFPVKS